MPDHRSVRCPEVTRAARGDEADSAVGGGRKKPILSPAEQKVAARAAQEIVGWSLFNAPNLKAALDLDWADADPKHHALQRWCDELDALPGWIGTHFPQERQSPPLTAALHTLQALRAQDLEPEPAGGTRIRQGVVKDRQIVLRIPKCAMAASPRRPGLMGTNGTALTTSTSHSSWPPRFCRPTPGYRRVGAASDRCRTPARQVTSLPIDRGSLGG